MKKLSVSLLLAAIVGVGPAQAVDLFSANGEWVGTGSLSTSVERPMQPARCEVEVEQKSVGSDVSVTGRCVVSAGASGISFRVVRGERGRVRGAIWAAATDDLLQLDGKESEGAVEMNATGPWVVDGESYETRITVGEPDPESFAIRQLVRAEGDTRWRVIVDMVYRQR